MIVLFFWVSSKKATDTGYKPNLGKASIQELAGTITFLII